MNEKHEELHECDNCGKSYAEHELAEIKDYFQRVTPGCAVPSGECPECGALCFPRKEVVPSDNSIIKTLRYVSISKLVNASCVNAGEFYEELAGLSAFTWGDGNYTLISKDRFLGVVRDMDEAGELIPLVEDLPTDVYVDLEN